MLLLVNHSLRIRDRLAVEPLERGGDGASHPPRSSHLEFKLAKLTLVKIILSIHLCPVISSAIQTSSKQRLNNRG